MNKNRLEAFSDGVLAIIITIMVLELEVPHEGNLHGLYAVIPDFLSYILSFVYIGIYWNNHHHMLHRVKVVGGRVLWSNLHLLFWLSLVPFITRWMNASDFSDWTVAIYGFVLFMAGVAYHILAQSLVNLHGKHSDIARALGNDRKGIISISIYFAGIVLAFFSVVLSLLLYTVVAAMWLIPDKRMEKKLENTVD